MAMVVSLWRIFDVDLLESLSSSSQKLKKRFDCKAKEETNDQFIARLKKEYYHWFRNWNINDTSAIINILIT